MRNQLFPIYQKAWFTKNISSFFTAKLQHAHSREELELKEYCSKSYVKINDKVSHIILYVLKASANCPAYTFIERSKFISETRRLID